MVVHHDPNARRQKQRDTEHGGGVAGVLAAISVFAIAAAAFVAGAYWSSDYGVERPSAASISARTSADNLSASDMKSRTVASSAPLMRT